MTRKYAEDAPRPQAEYQKKFREICSDVQKHLRKFLVGIATHENGALQLEILTGIYFKKRKYPIVLKLGKKLMKLLEAMPDSLDRNQRIDRAQTMIREAHLSLNPGDISEHLLPGLHSATQTGIAGTLVHLCTIRNSDLYDDPSIQAQVDQIKNHIVGLARLYSGSNKLIDAYLQTWDFIESPSAKHLKWLGRWLMAPNGPIKALDRTVLDELVKLITSAIARQINRQDEKSGLDFGHWWRIMKWGLDHDIIPKEEQIGSRTLKNIIGLLCIEGKVDEATEIHQRYQGRILDDPEDMTYEFNQGVIYFHQGKFRKAFHRFNSSYNYRRDSYLKIHSHAYRSQTALELILAKMQGDFRLENLTSSFRRALRNNPKSVGERGLQLYSSLIKWVEKVGNLTTANPDEIKEKNQVLKGGISEDDHLPEHLREWLLAKLEQIKDHY